MKKLLAFVAVAVLCVPAMAEEKKKPTPEEQFKKMDADSDGKLTKKEFIGKRKGEKQTQAETMFTKKDKNKDGSLDLEEFKAGGKKVK
jgi:Ca2+-binding EF-hand superfamily protein